MTGTVNVSGGVISMGSTNYGGGDLGLYSGNSGAFIELVSNGGHIVFAMDNQSSARKFDMDTSGNLTISGSLTQNSDQRLKTNIQSLAATSGLASILQLNPVTFQWNPGANNDARPQFGFIAQDVERVFPELVMTGGTSTITIDGGATTTVADTKVLNYIGLISPLVKAIQEIATIAGPFKANLIAWLASAENGIGDLYASIIHAREGYFSDKLCVGDTCVTPDEFLRMTEAASAATAEGHQAGAPGGSSATGGADVSSTTPETGSSPTATLTLNGNNPAQWQLNNPWQDNLGALFTHSGQSETIYSTSTVDVSAAGTTTISYWALIPASDPAQWLHTTRTVVISAPANDNPPPLTTATSTDGAATTSTSSTQQ